MKLAHSDAAQFAVILGEPGVECFALPRREPGLLAVCGERQAGLFVLGLRGVDVLDRVLAHGGSTRRALVRYCRRAGRAVDGAEAAELVGLSDLLPSGSEVSQ